MKQFFSMQGLAVVACCLLVGCKKPHHYYATQAGSSGGSTDMGLDADARQAAESTTYALRIKDMTVDQLRTARTVYEQQDEALLLSKVLERLIKISPDHQERASCTAQLATMYLGMGQFEKARTLYQQFLQEYPGSPLRKQVMFRLIMAYHWDRAIPERDQELTYQTMQWCDRWIQEYGTLPLNATPEQQEELQTLIQTLARVKQSCCYDLVLGEIERLDFYATKYLVTQERSALCSAHNRLRHIMTTWQPLLVALNIPLESAQELAQEPDCLQRQDGTTADTVDVSAELFDDPLGTMTDLRTHLAQELLHTAALLKEHIYHAQEQDGSLIVQHLW